jgi:cbb3-type cytochrome oxidase subunit 3
MGLILLEALGALVILGVIVWWTMFSGRRRGEIDEADPDEARPTAAPRPGDERPGG